MNLKIWIYNENKKNAILINIHFTIFKSILKVSLDTPLDPEVFVNHLFSKCYDLGYDAVPNIRMAVANCFSVILKQNAFDDPTVLNKVIHVLRKMQSDSDIDVRDIALNCQLPPKNSLDEDYGTEDNEDTGNLNQTFAEQGTDLASLSTASTVDMNSTDENSTFYKENEESDESQDSIRLYMDTDEKNSSRFFTL